MESNSREDLDNETLELKKKIEFLLQLDHKESENQSDQN